MRTTTVAVTILSAWMASSLPASAGGFVDLPGVEVIAPEVVLAEHTAKSADGALLFRDPSGGWVRMITSTEDPEIRNPGEGAFFPASVAEVEAAIRAIPARLLADVEVRVFLLPYPRSGMVGSSADGIAVYITPGVRAYTPAEIHYLVAHELGHAFHRRYLAYGDPGWDRYRELRGIADPARYSFDGAHADRPQEIFAEDFRVLFGGALARADGGIENRDLPLPASVQGLHDFFLRLADRALPAAEELGALAAAEFQVRPNPVGPGGLLRLRVPADLEVRRASLFEVSGRRVDALTVRREGDEWAVTLPDDTAPGAFWIWLELSSGRGRAVPVRILPSAPRP